MFQLKVSNVLESLADDMGNSLKANTGNVFTPHYIVTQTDGMNIWLKQQFAGQLGIVANIDFRKPNDLILKVYQLLGGVFVETLSRESLVWFLYQLMGQRDFINRFPIQAQYFNVTGPEKDLKRMGLAEKIADLFDQYQIYRPEIIKDWNRLDEKESSIDWQAFLWIKARRLSSLDLPDKTFISDYILEQLKIPARRDILRKRLPQIYLFGLSIITRYHMDILSEIAKVTDVFFYLLNPAPDIYWQDDKNERDVAMWRKRGAPDTETQVLGNPLLTSWGKVLQNTFRLLFRNEELINNYDTIATKEPEVTTLLGRIQNDIFNNSLENSLEIFSTNLQDETITIQSNYTIAREVESFYQYLVHLVDAKHTALSPRDVVVMVSDIDAYAPYIKAVFDNAPYRFRYKIADVSITQGDNIYSALQQMLLLNENTFTAESVMQMLDSSFIRKRFRIERVEELRKLVRAATIRFGMEGYKEDETYLVSWSYGIKRIMLGLCMSGGELYKFEQEELYPLDLAEGAASWDVIRFCHFVEVLMSSIKNRRRSRSIEDWVRYVEQTVMDLVFLPEDEPNEDFSSLTERLMRYNELAELMDEEVAYEIFAHNIVAALELESRSSLFVNDGITFCSLIPMRSIPFKVVAMLGMDHDKFPRREKIVNFNLITRKHQLGDRNVKDNDKHLFLETVLSAKEYLYISYLGKSVADNTPKPPSILVEELLGYIQSNIEDGSNATQHLVTHQPLHSFSHRFNQPESKLYYYSDSAASLASSLLSSKAPVSEIGLDEIKFSDVVGFYKHAIKSFYNKTLGIYYGNEELLLEETELFDVGSLEEWSLKNAMLPITQEQDLSILRHKLVREGALPLKNIGQAASERIYNDIAPVLQLLHKETGNEAAQHKTFSLDVNGVTVSGQLTNIYDGKYVQLSWSGNVVRYMIEAYLNTLAGIATGTVHDLVLITGKNESNIYRASIYNIKPDEARRRIAAIVDFYRYGLSKKIPFTHHFYKDPKQLVNLQDAALRAMMDKKVANNQVPFDDAYLLKEYEQGLFEQTGIAQDFLDAASLVIAPLSEVFPTYQF